MNTSYTYALLIRPFTGTYHMAVRSGGSEWMTCQAFINPGTFPSTYTVRSGYNSVAGARTLNAVVNGGLNDFFFIVCRLDAATSTHKLRVYCVNPAHPATGVETVDNASPQPANIVFNDKIEVPLALGGSWAFNVRSGAYHDRAYFWNRALSDSEASELFGGGLIWTP